MKIILQKVSHALVANNEMYNEINDGYCLLVGVSKTSTEDDARVLAKKIANARIFEDKDGKINFCLLYTSPSPRDVEESRMPSSA